MELSFGEQIKILLKRKNMTIKELADLYVEKTGMPMSRQNLTQRLRRDNFPEQDMRILAALLGYQVSIQLSRQMERFRNCSRLPLPLRNRRRQHLLRKHWKKQSRISVRKHWMMHWKIQQMRPSKPATNMRLPPIQQNLRPLPMHTRCSRSPMRSVVPARSARSIL